MRVNVELVISLRSATIAAGGPLPRCSAHRCLDPAAASMLPLAIPQDGFENEQDDFDSSTKLTSLASFLKLMILTETFLHEGPSITINI